VLRSGQAVLTTAMLVLLAVVGVAVHQTRRAERSYEATAQRALRDYAAVAAWQFARRASDELHQDVSTAMSSVGTRIEAEGRAGGALPSPDTLLVRDTTACAIRQHATLAFRLDLARRTLITAGDSLDATTRREMVERLPALAGTGGAEPHRLVVARFGGRTRIFAAVLVRDRAGRWTAIYGVETDTASLRATFARVLRVHSLLPQSLVGQPPHDTGLQVSVHAPDGTLLFRSASVSPGSPAASDTLNLQQSNLAATVALDPALGSRLLIGGLPPSRLPALLVLLGICAMLTGIALVLLRRERALVRIRSQFVANVSHELRTPLAQISMFGETLMLGRERSVEERLHFASVIFREARRLTTLVESVLHFSRSEAGHRALRPEARDVTVDVHDALAAFGPLADAGGMRLCAAIPDGVAVLADAGALRQVLLNLFDNAVKYGVAGQTIRVTVERRGAEVVVGVADEGPGIPERDRERVLEPFTRLERADRPRVAGTGIGLAVVRDLVDEQGGRLWIEDAPGGGARVVFTLPVAEDAPPPVAHASYASGAAHA
jgi:signal transduction histidine kinase